MKRKLLFIIFCFSAATLFAGTGPKINFPLNGINFIINNNSNQPVMQATAPGNINWAAQVNSGQEFYAFANTLELYQYETTDLPVNFEYDLTVKGELTYQQTGSSAVHSQIVELHINNHMQGSSSRIDFFSYSNAYNSTFTIQSVTLTGTPPTGTDLYTAVSKIVELNLSITQTHYVQPNLTLPVSVTSGNCVDGISNELVISWPLVPYAEDYELEILYVDDYSTDGTPLPQSAIRYDFAENATRIVLKQLFYRLPIVYDRGYVLYRIRPVGRGGPLWDKRIPGPWSAGSVSGTVNNFPAKLYISANWAHTRNSLNWQLTTTFAEDGKRKDVVQYSDGLYMTRQTVTGVSETNNLFTRNNNDNPMISRPVCAEAGGDKTKEIVAQENIYDFNGRVGVQIMPVPTGTHRIDYIAHLNKNTAGVPYSWSDFDIKNACILQAGQLSQAVSGAFGAGTYYSPNNPNKLGYNAFIPDGGGYPFSRVQYTDDNTGRLSRQGGVGPDFQLESTHETKFFYGTPNQVELDRMFGTEVGYAQRYLKKMVVDPNGQTAVTYENPEGKTIATALAGNKPNNLLSLDNEPQTPVEIDVDLAADNKPDDLSHSKTVNKQFLVPTTGQYIFNYTVNGQALQYVTCDNANVCLDCIYDFAISLHSNDGCTNIPVFNYSGTFGDLIKGTKVPHIDNTCFTAGGNFDARPADFPTGFTTNLSAGSYTIEKKLTVNKNAAEAYVNMVFKDTCRAEFNSLLARETARIDTTNCSQTCASCQAAVPNDPAQYAALCAKPLNDCDQARKMMLADLKPGGQYAQFSVDANGKYYSNDPLSIFSLVNHLPLNGSLSTTIVDLNSTNPADPLYINNCIDNWNLTTAQENVLLQSHPEHCMLDWCTFQNPGANYDLKLRTTDNYTDAVSLGLINGGSTPIDTYVKLLNGDPFFATNSLDRSTFLATLTAPCPGGESVLQMAMHAAYCSTTPAMQNMVSNIANNQGGSSTVTNLPACVLPDGYLANTPFGNNAYDWKMLRDLYLSYKEKYLYKSRHDYGVANHCLNVAIGASFYFILNTMSGPESHSPEGVFSVGWGDIPDGNVSSYYANKIKRFTSRYDAFSHTTAQPPVNLGNINLYDDCPTPQNVATIQSQVTAIAGNFLCDSAKVAGDACEYLCNSSFEQFHGIEVQKNYFLANQSNVFCWKTCSSDTIIAIYHSGYNGTPAYAGGYFTEVRGDLCQPFTSTGTKSVVVSFAHRGKYAGLDKIEVYIGPDGGPYINLGTYADNSSAWGYHSTAPYTINAGVYRLIFKSVSVNNGLAPVNDGNFIDAVTVTCVTEHPATGVSARVATQKAKAVAPLSAAAKQSAASFAVKTAVKTNDKPDLCKTLSPFANELFSFLNGLKKPKTPTEGVYTYEKRRSALYTKFTGSTAIKYAYDDKQCILNFTGQTAGKPKDEKCTINFDNCNWMNPDMALVSITPYFDPGSTQTNKFTLTYTDYKTKQTLKVQGVSNCLPINECPDPVLCSDDSLLNLPKTFVNYNSCVAAKYLMAHENAEQRYTNWVDSMRTDLLQKYYAKCMQATEDLNYTYSDDQFHYTLYYYDQAGNLTRTIPPAGVRLLRTASLDTVDADRIANSGTKVPPHFFITNYKYNSLNQLIWQSTPDAGNSAFFYDKLGRIAASQNAKQRNAHNYSYTYYDILGRTVESGELVNTSLNQSDIDNYPAWPAFLHSAGQRRDIIFTKYDEPLNSTINNKFGAGQQNLRGRVASIFSFADNNNQTLNHYGHATHYTYDVTGNVPVIIQDYPGTPLGDKVLAYNFDLVSGKVNEVRYEPGMQDEFRHRYYYDDELRLTNVYTSRKGIIWQRDAEYFYYKHGPLARTELGQLKVQGLDYIYTLQGWIKGVNGVDEDITQDAGRDGIALNNPHIITEEINGQQVTTTVETNPAYNTTGEGYHSLHSPVAADAFSFVLSYFYVDYKPIGSQNTAAALNTTMPGVKSLYNGNISRMYTYLQTLGGLGMNYRYDQLNRFKTQQAFTLNGSAPSSTNTYEMDLNYDGNGNIINLYRLGRQSNLEIDKQVYHYYDSNNNEIPYMGTPTPNATNRLASVTDQINAGNYPETGSPVNGTVTDIDSQQPSNYKYDEIGNLTKDGAEGITAIQWNLLNKITEIDKTASQLNFGYDALGNRVYKKYTGGATATETYYVRDAKGTIMGTYENKDGNFTWQEQELYGSGRLGLWQPNQIMAANEPAWTGTVDWQNIQPQAITEDNILRGSKQYELTNHLGNVLATISDKKIQIVPAPAGTSGITADLLTATDYYAFGMQMPGRNFSIGNYRFGFNGKENDNDVKGDGNEQDYGMRIYDPRLGRFLSVDPLTKKYPWYTPYQFAGNTPIMAVDLDGQETKVAIDGSVLNGPVNLQALNAEIIKKDPKVLLNDNLIQVNAKIMFSGIDQPFYATAASEPEESPLFEFKATTEIGLKAGFKAEIAGAEAEAELGIARPVTTATITDKGGKTKVGGDSKLKAGVGTGPIAVEVERNLKTGEGKASLKAGPKEFIATGNKEEKKDQDMLTVFDFKATFLVGGEISLKINQSVFSGPSGYAQPEKTSMAPSDATQVVKPIVHGESRTKDNDKAHYHLNENGHGYDQDKKTPSTRNP